jgi:hypothetical protein
MRAGHIHGQGGGGTYASKMTKIKLPTQIFLKIAAFQLKIRLFSTQMLF